MNTKNLLYVPLFLLSGALGTSTAIAADAPKAKAKPKIDVIVPQTNLTKNCKPLINKNLKIPKVAMRGLPERAHKRISRALEKLAEENHVEAIDMLKKLFNSTKDQNVKATVAKYIGIAYAQQNDTLGATPYFEQALDIGKGYMQPNEMQDLTQNVASMHYSNDNKEAALKFLKRWLDNSNKDNDQVYLLYAAILADSNKLREAVCPAYWAAKTASKPLKSAFGLLLNGHFELKDYDGSIAVLKQLIQYFPTEKRYWRNLASIYSSQDKIEDALVVSEMFYVMGYMENENDYKQLSSLFAYSDIAFRTAEILKEGIDKGIVEDTEKNWKNIASNYHVASELKKAIDAYGRSAAKTKTGENDLKRAELLADTEQFKQAIAGFNTALEKGSLKDPGKAHFRKGLSYLGLKQYNSAIAALDKATKYKKWRKQAVQWTGYVKNQKANAAKL